MNPHDIKPGDTVRIPDNKRTRAWPPRFHPLIGESFIVPATSVTGPPFPPYVLLTIPPDHFVRTTPILSDRVSHIIRIRRDLLEKVNQPLLNHLE